MINNCHNCGINRYVCTARSTGRHTSGYNRHRFSHAGTYQVYGKIQITFRLSLSIQPADNQECFSVKPLVPDCGFALADNLTQ